MASRPLSRTYAEYSTQSIVNVPLAPERHSRAMPGRINFYESVGFESPGMSHSSFDGGVWFDTVRILLI
ncbi:hypothetical protein N7472_004603 [Penicillium cf. griseofulvum]|uniref:Uncharacterized protein n=1 Tax=Penicillium cf. griseofulvum TaxID=2972120 RepID=A0A9W9JN40_9EURO|nr:hypothetical protein N7472_004603 [Penicillium cf. griseofulvum]KAJ5442165.1 hypothetical protein N7445_005172 [Penicillium cf. griseofulvum]